MVKIDQSEIVKYRSPTSLHQDSASVVECLNQVCDIIGLNPVHIQEVILNILANLLTN